MKSLLLPILSVFLLSLASSIAPADDARSEPRGAASVFTGVWILDRDASDSIAPLMEAIDAPWIARKMANVMTPTLTISLLGDDGLRVVNENPIRNSDQDMPADGIDRERTDPLGRKIVSKESWNDAGQLVVTQRNHVDSKRVVVIESTWSRVGDHIEIENHIEAKDSPLRIRRIFRRQS
jgi:hypothetical protein